MGFLRRCFSGGQSFLLLSSLYSHQLPPPVIAARLPRPKLAPVPSISLDIPSEVMLGEAFTFTVSFRNTGDQTGYGPYIDLYLPLSGVDCSTPEPGNDGITLRTATCLEAAIERTRLDCPAVSPGPGRAAIRVGASGMACWRSLD